MGVEEGRLTDGKKGSLDFIFICICTVFAGLSVGLVDIKEAVLGRHTFLMVICFPAKHFQQFPPFFFHLVSCMMIPSTEPSAQCRMQFYPFIQMPHFVTPSNGPRPLQQYTIYIL